MISLAAKQTDWWKLKGLFGEKKGFIDSILHLYCLKCRRKTTKPCFSEHSIGRFKWVGHTATHTWFPFFLPSKNPIVCVLAEYEKPFYVQQHPLYKCRGRAISR